MKFRTTAKAIREGYGRKIAISYCGAQHLLYYRSPIAYTCGVYGWNFDIYAVIGVAICTGYRGMVGRSPDYETLKKYETEAEKIVYSRGVEYETKREKVEALLSAFIAEVYGEGAKA